MDYLKRYYGEKFKTLNPSVLREGIKYAVVRLFPGEAVPGFPATSYVLILKNGRHGASVEKSLFEGTPTDTDIQRMVRALNFAEAESG